MTGRPLRLDPRPMEEVLEGHEATLLAVVAALEADPGGLTWHEATGSEMPREPCPEIAPGAELATLTTLAAYAPYRGAAAGRAADVVSAVAAGRGFTEMYRKVREDVVRVIAEDAHGAGLTFSSSPAAGVATLAVTTACHRWEGAAPDLDHVRPLLRPV